LETPVYAKRHSTFDQNRPTLPLNHRHERPRFCVRAIRQRRRQYRQRRKIGVRFALDAAIGGPEAEAPRRAARKSGGGGGSFDGAWVVNSIGCGGTSAGAVVVTSGRIIGEGVTGTVSPNGAARSVGNYNGIRVISSGHVSGRSGSGTFRRSDGCAGTWTSSKQ
jgi:hypothetical protein